MLSALSIRNVVLIEALDLDLAAGLTALTGETGAGKSIILDSLGMATGARSDKGLVRAGFDHAQCTAVFDVSPLHPAWAVLEDADLDMDRNEGLTLRRRVSADGRSKAYINDTPVGVRLLSDIGGLLLEVHGQHDGRGLLDASNHIHMLDDFADHDGLLADVAQSYKARQEAVTYFESLKAKRDKAVEDREFLTHAIGELDRLNPMPGEEISLAAERSFLQGAEGALTELTAAQDALGEDGEFENRLSAALNGIERVKSKIGEGSTGAAKLDTAIEALERAMLETEEARNAVSNAAMEFDIEPGQLDIVEERLFALRAAARKYGVDITELASKRTAFASDLDDIDNVDAVLKAAEKAVATANSEYQMAAKKLSTSRAKASKLLEKSVLTELPPLKMERALFTVDMTDTPPSAMGTDRVRFHVATNPGTAMGPLDKIASGGEMARFALAIKVALAGRNDAVLVFDEVDQGVGGAVAAAVGKRLARLSDLAQVFVVTHSPQVAACAAHQFRIEKSSTGSTTTTHVHRVSDDAREEEIARMLAGETVTSEARAAARQLMAS
ncbi:DNA repair protein RecN [Fretibacter rubidus]|uniref:DNA repair protein RecN n=1 Tax=Fretibacter rubidus TaxID=570162 RepID=UPI00352B907B